MTDSRTGPGNGTARQPAAGLPLLRSLTIAIAVALLLVACSGPSFSVGVRDVVIRASNSGGMICYVKGSESSPVRFSSATYRADGTYSSSNLLADSVTIKIYGRTEAPASDCVAVSEPKNIELSKEITLPVNDSTPVEIGGADYGGQLAEIISRDSYWIGARISGDYTLLDGEEISLENGRISVSVW
ncbi:MAG: hypothetical protein WD314_00750 [Trueperaceae bacterium]